jgi:hypothetical protein
MAFRPRIGCVQLSLARACRLFALIGYRNSSDGGGTTAKSAMVVELECLGALRLMMGSRCPSMVVVVVVVVMFVVVDDGRQARRPQLVQLAVWSAETGQAVSVCICMCASVRPLCACATIALCCSSFDCSCAAGDWLVVQPVSRCVTRLS